MKLEEWFLALVLCAVLAMMFLGSWRQRREFSAACAAAGGVSVWDGRQHQCLKPQPVAPERKTRQLVV